MTKKDIVLKIADESKFNQVVVKKVVHRVFDVMLEALLKNDKIEIRNFGVFKVKQRRGRIGRNPRTGDEVPVPEKKVVVFKPGLILKHKVK